MNLRPYQSICLDSIEDGFASRPSLLAVLATGLGKTVIFSHLAHRQKGRVLVLAHRDELVRQAAEKLHMVCGEEAGIEMGQERANGHRLIVSSVQTLSRPNRQQVFDPNEFDLLVIDEAHHAVARTYKDVVAHFRQNPALHLLGVTATPKRADELAMGQVFDHVCFDYGIEPAVDDGWLVPVRQQAVTVEGLDFSKVRVTAGDLNEADLEKILAEEKVLHATAVPTVEIVGDAPTLVFCVTVAHAHRLAAVIDRYRKDRVIALDGSTPKEERRTQVERFKNGEIQFLCNCGLFLEGFDAPTTAAVVMARPTKSLGLYAQVLGRGTRPLPGVVDVPSLITPADRRRAIAGSLKPSMLALDFVGNSGRHRIVTATDLLGGKWEEPVRQYARQTAEEEGRPAMVGEALERAADELELLKEIAERRRREAIRAQAEYHAREVSPFGRGGGAPRVEQGQQPQQGQSAFTESVVRDMATDKQVWYLVKRLGWQEHVARKLGKRQASAIIGKAKEREGVA